MAEKELTALESRYRAVEKEASEGKSALAKMAKEVDALRKKAESSGWSQEREKEGERLGKEAREGMRRAVEVRTGSLLSITFGLKVSTGTGCSKAAIIFSGLFLLFPFPKFRPENG